MPKRLPQPPRPGPVAPPLAAPTERGAERPRSQGGAGSAARPPRSSAPIRPAQIRPRIPLTPPTSQGDFGPPQALTPEQRAQFYQPGGPGQQYQGVDQPRPQSYALREGDVAPVRLVVRRGQGQTVIVEAGTKLTQDALRAAQAGNEWSSYFGGVAPPSPLRPRKPRLGALGYQAPVPGQQFGLPEGDPNKTMRGKFAQFLGSPLGAASQIGIGALPGVMVGASLGGPVGALAGGLLTGGVTAGGLAYQRYLQSAYGLAEAQKKFDESVFGQFGKVLDAPRQWLEQGIGVGTQAVEDPTEVFQNLGAAWEAARLTYVSAPIDPRVLDPARWWAGDLKNPIDFSTNRTFVDYDLPETTGGVAALVEARKRIAAGESAAQVFAEIQGRYGAPGQIRELLSGFLLDPLNFAEGAQGLALRGLARAAHADDLALATRLARGTGPLSRFTQGGLIDTAQAYRNIKLTKLMREGFTDARHLSWFQRALIGPEMVGILRGEYHPPQPWELWRLTPESQAREQVVQANNYVQAHVLSRLPNDETIAARAAELLQGMKTARLDENVERLDPAARAMLSLEGQVVQRSLRHGGDVELNLLTGWQDMTSARALLADVAAKLGDTPTGIIKRATDGEAGKLLRLYGQAGGQVAKGVTAKSFEQSMRAFAEGAPYNPEMFKAALLSGLLEQSGKWAADFFKIKAPGFLEQLAGVVKAAQSAVLLGLNPGYLVNNFLGNQVTMLARGAWGFQNLNTLREEMGRFGLAPARMIEGVSPADEAATLSAQQRYTTLVQAHEAGLRPIQEARTPASPLENLRQHASRLAQMTPFLKASQAVERHASANAFGAGFRQMWERAWRRGVGFERLPAELEQALAGVDPRLPDFIYAAAEAGYTPQDISARVLERAPRPVVQEFYTQVARTLGLDDERLRSLLESGGLGPALNARLAQLPDNATRQDVRQVFQEVRVQAEQFMAEQEAAYAQAQLDYVAQAAGGNELGLTDAGALLETFDQLTTRQAESFISHKRLLEEVWDDWLGGRITRDEQLARMKDAGDKLYRQGLFVEQQATADGLAAGMKTAGLPLDPGFPAAQRTIHDLTGDFHAQREQVYREFFRRPKNERTPELWAATQQQVDDAYRNFIGHRGQLQESMDAYLAAAYERRFPASGERVRAWRDGVRTHEAAYEDAVLKQFTDARALPDPVARNQLWRAFDDRMIQQRLAWTREAIAARKAIWETVPGPQALQNGTAIAQGAAPAPMSADISTLPTPQAADELQRQATAGAQLAEAQSDQALTAEYFALDRDYTRLGGEAPPELVARFRDVQQRFNDRFPEAPPTRATPPEAQSAVTWNLSRKRVEIGGEPTPEQQDLLKSLGWRQEKATGAWYKRGDFASEGRRVMGEAALRPFEQKRLERLRAGRLPLAPAAPPPEALTPAGAIRLPRRELPPALSQALEMQAREMLRQVAEGEAGQRVFVRDEAGYLTGDVLAAPSTYPDWYGALNARRETIVNALQKIVKDAGADVDRAGQAILRRLKQAILDELAKTDPLTGRPPEPEVLRFLGRSSAEIDAARAAWRVAQAEPFVQPFLDSLTEQGGLSRAQFVERLGREFENVTPEQARAVVAITDARAQAWARQTGRDPEQWYAAHLADVRTAGEAGDLFQLATPEQVQARLARARTQLGESGIAQFGGIPLSFIADPHTRALVEEYRSAALDQRFLEAYGRAFNLGDQGQIARLLAGEAAEFQARPDGAFDIVLGDRAVANAPSLDEARRMVQELNVKNYTPRLYQTGPEAYRVFRESGPDGVRYYLHDAQTNRRIQGPFESSEQARARIEELVAFAERGFYQGEGMKKGSVEFLEDGRAIVRAFETADVSTLVHELGHVFRRDLPADDLARAEIHYGVENGEWQVGPEEQFARDFERYLATADAPTPQLRGVFERLRAWLTEIYRSVRDFLTRPSDETTAIFDRLLRVDDATEGAGNFALTPRTEGRVLYQANDGSLVVRSGDEVQRLPPASAEPPLLPPGVLADDGAMPTPVAAAQSETYWRQLRPALAELQRAIEADVQTGRVKGQALDPDQRQAVTHYLQRVGDQMGEAKLLALKWGEYKRDAALLNYSRRYMLDTYLGMVAPYEFFATHSMMKWALHSLQTPALLAHYYRIKRFLETNVQKPGFPSRLMGRVKIPLPWLPEWMGGGVWVDPLKLGLPLETFGAPWEQYAQSQTRLESRVQRELEKQLEAGQITQADYDQAVASYQPGMLEQATGQGGNELWNRTTQSVMAADPSQRFDGADFATMLYSPSLPLKWAYEVLRGTPERIGPLPVTRDVKNLTAALGLGGAGGLNLEAGVRRALALPVFDQWADYRIDRELANMAAEGLLTAEQAKAAMIERSGAAFDEAQRREAQQGGADPNVQVLGRLFGGAGVYPEGEERQRQLALLNRAAWQAQDNGDVDALNEFMEAYPEYEARLALKNDPDERLQNFLVDQVWAGYNALPTLYRRAVQDQFGPEFQQAFLEKETRSYRSIPPETLAAWARTLGRYVPGNLEAEPLRLDLAPEPVAREAEEYYDRRARAFEMERVRALQTAYFQIPEHARATATPMPADVEAYYTARDRLFPDIVELLDAYGNLPKNTKPAERDRLFPGIGQKLDAYFALPARSRERKAFRETNPDVAAYWEWEKQFDAEHPEAALRKQFRERFPVIEQYFTWQEAWRAGHPDVGRYLDETHVSARTAFLQANAELNDYWDFRRAWMESHPVTASYLTEQTPDGVGENRQYEATADRRGVEIYASPEMHWLVSAHLFAGAALPARVRGELERQWEAQGRPAGGFDRWLLNVMAFGGELGPAGYLNMGQGGYQYPGTPGPAPSPGGAPSASRGVRGGHPRASGPPAAIPAPDPYATRPVSSVGGIGQWREMAAQYGQQHGVPPEYILALILAESGGRADAVGDGGHSVGLFQLHDRGVGTGYTVEQRQDPRLQFELMMPRIARAYQQGLARGLSGAPLAVYVGREAERPAAGAERRYGVTYQQIVGLP